MGRQSAAPLVLMFAPEEFRKSAQKHVEAYASAYEESPSVYTQHGPRLGDLLSVFCNDVHAFVFDKICTAPPGSPHPPLNDKIVKKLLGKLQKIVPKS